MAADDTEGVFASVHMITGNWLHETDDSQHVYIMTRRDNSAVH